VKNLTALSTCIVSMFAAGIVPAEIYFPPSDGEWGTVSPADANLSAEAIESALSFAQERNSSGVVITYNGRMVAER